MRHLALLLLATTIIGVAGACPALAEVTILRGSSAPPEPPAPPPPVVVLTQREVVYVPVYNPPAYYVAFPAPIVRHHLPAPVTSGAAPGVASGWPLFGASSPRR